MSNKRGLSAIITTLLVVLLVLVAVGIVWVVISRLIRTGAEGVGVGARCLNIDVSVTAVNCNNPEVCVVTLTRTGSDNDVIGGVKLVFSNETENSGVINKSGNIEKLVGKTITNLDSTLDAPDKLEVTVYLKDASGNEQLCSQTTYSNIGIGIGGDDDGEGEGDGEAVCGDGSCDSGETCGDSDIVPECNSDCGVCSSSDCGDFIVEGGEECDSDELPDYCIDDGLANECTCEVGFIPDPESNGCIVDPAVVCNLVFEEGEQCDGGADCILPGEPNECTCPDGYDPDGVGGCIVWSYLNSGIVEEVWPSTGVFFASSDLPDAPTDYTGYYVSYTGALFCKLIAYYLTTDLSSYDNVIVAFSTATNPVIAVENNYEIWETSVRCEASI